MNQASYVLDLVEIHHLKTACRVSTPCDNHFKDLSKNEDTLMTTHNPYCSLVGALLWLLNGTWSDITFAVDCLSSFMNSPMDVHWRAAQRVLVYARDKSEYSINLGGNDLTLSGHSDSDPAEQREDCRSTTGFILSLGTSPVSWKSRRQPTIASSSTEAEFMGLTDSSREAIWWLNIMNEFDSIDLTQPIVIYYNNKGAGELAMNPCHHSRSNHIDVKHCFICGCISNNTISLYQVPTLSRLADIITKPLQHLKHLSNIKLVFQAEIEGLCWNMIGNSSLLTLIQPMLVLNIVIVTYKR